MFWTEINVVFDLYINLCVKLTFKHKSSCVVHYNATVICRNVDMPRRCAAYNCRGNYRDALH